MDDVRLTEIISYFSGQVSQCRAQQKEGTARVPNLVMSSAPKVYLCPNIETVQNCLQKEENTARAVKVEEMRKPAAWLKSAGLSSATI